jgi:methylmalonyl-CoA/ethylmalonyl-CoA epimerase
MMTMPASSLRLHHVGFVVPNVAAGAAELARSLGATWDGAIYHDPHQAVKVTFIATIPGDSLIELVEPASADSPVARFLRENGGGFHHVCYVAADLEKQMADMKARGALIVRRPKPAVAFQGRRIAWMLASKKFLVEFLEQAR